MSNQRLIRLAAAALIVAAVSLTFGRILHPADELAGWTSPLWGPSHVLWLVGLVTGMIGVVGLYLRQRQEVRLLGFVGAGLAWIGMALLSGAMYFEAVIWPDLLVQTPAAIEWLGNLSGYGTYLAVFLVSVASFGVGFLIFGIAMLRARLLPRWAIILVIIGAVIGGPQGFLPATRRHSFLCRARRRPGRTGFLALGGSVGPLPRNRGPSCRSPVKDRPAWAQLN